MPCNARLVGGLVNPSECFSISFASPTIDLHAAKNIQAQSGNALAHFGKHAQENFETAEWSTRIDASRPLAMIRLWDEVRQESVSCRNDFLGRKLERFDKRFSMPIADAKNQ